MKYARQYLQSAKLVCDLYDGSIPLSSFLKQYFSLHKKFGSKDRKNISHLCYCYYRLGKSCLDISFEERIRIAVFLCHDQSTGWEQVFDKEWIADWHSSMEKRIEFVSLHAAGFLTDTIFPWKKELNADTIDHHSFSVSHLVQPDLFLRVRPGKASIVEKKLGSAGILYKDAATGCIALPNGTGIDDLIEIDREAVVQDYSSQRIGEILTVIPPSKSLHVWDCCAASGGKSILAFDTYPSLRLTASDIRESIIQNLRKRFERAGVKADRVFTADISRPQPVPHELYDLVICDVPCTGSGTWGRTPEQLFFFKEEKIREYAALQQKIIANVLPSVKPGGYLLYSTCSVFSKENENIIEGLPLIMETIEMKWLNGYDRKADSMFAALLRKKP